MTTEKNKQDKQSHGRTFTGVVVSDRMNKTIVVRVDRVIMHPKYQKRYTSSRRYKVHDATGAHAMGDTVQFVECRPLSKDKKWRVLDSKNVK